ncbi:HNH endonuclease, partial [Leptospira sp. SA-E8]|uniref:HNH endonuclease n=1 Tax=Leptospira sp. SA-E8 TaxID=3422259 RepID=UPI003EBABF14
FKLSKNRCAICGKLGREVDHIKGSSNDIENLQLLCWDCHIAKTMQNHKLIKYSDPRLLDVILKNTELDKRVKRKKPFKICDDSVLWRSRLKKVNDDRKISYFKNVADFIKKQKFSNDTGQFIANKLNELRIPTFSNLGAWDRKSVGIILKLIKGK